MLSFIHAGIARFGVVRGGDVFDATGWQGCGDLRAALSKGPVEEMGAHALSRDPLCRIDQIRFLPPIPNPEKFLCIGLNYEGHRIETNSPLADHPQVFVRFNDSLTAHEEAIRVPSASAALDYEGELAVVIGKPGRNVQEKQALDFIAGVTCFNDGSVRDWQKHTSQFTPGKNFPSTGAIGPWLVTMDEVGDPTDLHLQTRLNGEVMQDDRTSNMTFSIQRIIAYCSTFTQLMPGDVIVTGTPSGVGYQRKPPRYMQPGDRVEVEIEKIGVLGNAIRAEDAS